MKSHARRLIASIFELQVRRVVKRHQVTVVAVAGSVGKTTTKAAIATVLSEKYRTLGQSGGYNSEIGLPLSVFGLEVPAALWNIFAWIWRFILTERQIYTYPFQVLVLELGTDHPGEIARYLRYLTPDVGVLTAVTPEHMENFPGGLDEVAAEEMLLATASKVIVINEDAVPAKYQHHYLKKHPDVIKYDHQTKLHAKPQVIGEHIFTAMAAAATVAEILKLTHKQIIAGLEKVRPIPGRMNPLPGINGSTIIDDSYNAQPDAVLAALNTLDNYQTTGRRIAILGSMNELGKDSPRYHQEVGAAAAGVDYLITIGALANNVLGPAAVAAGLDPTRFKPADSPQAAGEFVKLMLHVGDVVLVKGSQNGVFSEEAAKLLLADSADAAKLVRQSPAWMRIKAKQFPNKS